LSRGGEEHQQQPGLVTITGECDRFLYRMMRFLAGTLVQVGLGKLTPAEVAAMLTAKGRSGKGGGNESAYLAPAKGLCLDCCFYDQEEWDAPLGP
jgi:tRNA pseudouridine38-40 synthase